MFVEEIYISPKRHMFLNCVPTLEPKRTSLKCLSLQMIKFNFVNELCSVIKFELDYIRLLDMEFVPYWR